MFGLFGKLKPVKIRGYSGDKKYGVAAKSAKEVLKKGCGLLKLPPSSARLCLYEDGTEVTEEFFPTLADNTELVILSKNQTWTGVVCDIAQLLNTNQFADGIIEAAKGLLNDEQSSKRRKILSDLLQNLEDKSELESRKEDGDWFDGVDARFKTKSAYMKHNCENRIRSYMKEVDSVSKRIEKPKVKVEFLKTLKYLFEKLRTEKYNGSYFDRTENESDRLCTREGWFTCQGSFDQKVCESLHSINPYSSRESRIVFSTWNLDHRIEKKRTIIPTLVEVLQSHRSAELDLNYFYNLLFTRQNLKLVHIVCHKKGAHNLLCDTKKIYRIAEKKQKPALKKKRLV